MKKVYTKLFLTLTVLVVSLVMVVTVSYAWFTLANNPVANGIQVAIGGGSTILVASDLTVEEDGKVYHYPGEFQSTLKLNDNDNYAYLSDVKALVPVSTADGQNWFIPQYYDLLDAQVAEGSILTGTLKSEQDFILDNQLTYANLTDEEEQAASEGNYLYFDFWVVSPGQEYTLRVSMSDDSGTFVIALPQAAADENGNLALATPTDDASASIRVGFLVNPDTITDGTYLAYQQSSAYSEDYRKLCGALMEPGGETVTSSGYRFTIYEPNGDNHPDSDEVEDGDYVVTAPLGLQDDVVTKMDIQDILTVQKRSTWTAAESGTGTQLEQQFQTAIMNSTYNGLTAEEMTKKFYNEYLPAQVGLYVTKGVFVKNTENLYNAVDANGVVDAAYLDEDKEKGYTAGATDDVYIVKLQKNVPQRIRMFLWVEGEDVDCTQMVDTSSLMISLELAGSNTYG